MSALPSGLPLIVEEDEPLARFMTSSSWFARTTRRVKHNAFLPAPDDDTSVFRARDLPPEALWKIGEEAMPDVGFHGAGIVKASLVRKATLDVIAGEPPPRHANIRGWPKNDDPELQKAARKKIAMSVAEEALFVPRDQ